MKASLITILCLSSALTATAITTDSYQKASRPKKPNVAIRLNQVGYAPSQEKVVVVEGVNPNGKMTVSDATGQVIMKPKATRQARSPWSKKTRYIVDLSSLTSPGKYQLSVGSEIAELTVAERPLRYAAAAALKFFYLMRTGMPIEMDYAGVYARPAGHLDTRVLIHSSAASTLRPAGSMISSPLGWYDAGDYNKYIVNSAFSVGLMLLAYEQNKGYFYRLDTNIPESRNVTPDMLDEMMYNLKWMLTMQDPADGGVYHKLTTPNFEGFVMPTDCHQSRYVVAKTTTATLDFAAVMAQAARVFHGNRDYPEFSSQAEAAARLAWEWAKEHPAIYYRQNDMNEKFQPAVYTGAYDDEESRDERFWAVSELYLLTGDESFAQEARQLMPTVLTTPTWGNVAGLATLEWVANGKGELHTKALDELKTYCEELVSGVETSNFQAPFGDKKTDFGWGCLAEQCCVPAMILLYGDRYIEKGAYRRFALQNADYLLGRNATGYCYVTGFGTKSPMHPHHRISAADGIDAPFPGMLVGGPNPGQQDKASGIAYPSEYPDESYADVEASYASNEIAINWNASLLSLLAWLDREE